MQNYCETVSSESKDDTYQGSIGHVKSKDKPFELASSKAKFEGWIFQCHVGLYLFGRSISLKHAVMRFCRGTSNEEARARARACVGGGGGGVKWRICDGTPRNGCYGGY